MQIQFQGILKTERRQQGQMYLLPAEISARLENRRRQQRQQYLLAARVQGLLQNQREQQQSQLYLLPAQVQCILKGRKHSSKIKQNGQSVGVMTVPTDLANLHQKIDRARGRRCSCCRSKVKAMLPDHLDSNLDIFCR